MFTDTPKPSHDSKERRKLRTGQVSQGSRDGRKVNDLGGGS